jgi:hypothetical protein
MSDFRSRIDRLTTKSLTYLHRRFDTDHRRHRPLEIVYERAAEQSADFILANINEAVLFDARADYWRFVTAAVPKIGLIMECGVFQGLSINFIADRLKAAGDTRGIDGFDSFEGLEENWSGENLPSGHFDMKGKPPDVRPGVVLHKGWVQDTVQPYLDAHPEEPIALLHIDTDTYAPARYLLDAVKPRLVCGSIIAFDELVGYPNWQQHEYKALAETLERESYQFMAFTSRQAAIYIR